MTDCRICGVENSTLTTPLQSCYKDSENVWRCSKKGHLFCLKHGAEWRTK